MFLHSKGPFQRSCKMTNSSPLSSNALPAEPFRNTQHRRGRVLIWFLLKMQNVFQNVAAQQNSKSAVFPGDLLSLAIVVVMLPSQPQSLWPEGLSLLLACPHESLCNAMWSGNVETLSALLITAPDNQHVHIVEFAKSGSLWVDTDANEELMGKYQSDG